MIDLIALLHPLLVHLPIGIFIMAMAMECYQRAKPQANLREAIELSLLVGVATAVLSVFTGWFLGDSGDYEEAALFNHKWLAIGSTILFAFAWYLRRTPWYFPLFWGGIVSLVATGHFGGAITHGDNYFSVQKNKKSAQEIGFQGDIAEDKPVFSGIIQPILQEKCVSCHGPSKQKGGLRLDGAVNIGLGGKNGKVLIPGSVDSSSLWQRINLPIQHDDHMPPSGKLQLSDTDIKLLKWWIESGASFDATLKDKPLPSELAALVQTPASYSDNPVFSKKVAKADAKSLEQLKTMGVGIQGLGEEWPWLSVSLAGLETADLKCWSALEAIAEQIVDLDLSHTEINDQDLKGKSFPNLLHLNLSHTRVGNGAVPFLLKAGNLERINLTNTLIDNKLEEVFPNLPELKKVYLWQTKATPEAVEAWSAKHPQIAFEFQGPDVSSLAPLRLLKPKLLCGRTFFDDTMHLDLELKFRGVTIYYTLGEDETPSQQSPVFKGPLVLDKTSHLRAYAAKEGWEDSPMVDVSFVKKKYHAKSAKYTHPPSAKYPFKGAEGLIDGKISDYRETDTWSGFEGEHLEATIDLGQPEDISNVFVHCLEYNVAWIFLPKAIHVHTSSDGKNYQHQVTKSLPVNSAMGDHKSHLVGLKFPEITKARFVRVKVESLLKNPSWHVGKGKPCWIFVDEMLIE
jgi:hypothetical protein